MQEKEILEARFETEGQSKYLFAGCPYCRKGCFNYIEGVLKQTCQECNKVVSFKNIMSKFNLKEKNYMIYYQNRYEKTIKKVVVRALNMKIALDNFYATNINRFDVLIVTELVES